jgi:hypothetical protein
MSNNYTIQVYKNSASLDLKISQMAGGNADSARLLCRNDTDSFCTRISGYHSRLRLRVPHSGYNLIPLMESPTIVAWVRHK